MVIRKDLHDRLVGWGVWSRGDETGFRRMTLEARLAAGTFIPGDAPQSSHVPVGGLEAIEVDRFVCGLEDKLKQMIHVVYRHGEGPRAAVMTLRISSATFYEWQRRVQWLWDYRRDLTMAARTKLITTPKTL